MNVLKSACTSQKMIQLGSTNEVPGDAVNTPGVTWKVVAPMLSKRTSQHRLEERFSEKFMIHEEGCWLWTGSLSSSGYGRFVLDRKNIVSAHRWGYRHFVGPFPEELDVDHLCRNRACVNPDHLEPVEKRVNILRGVGITAQYATRECCKHGHLFTPENTRIRADGGRRCRTCERATGARRRHRNRQPHQYAKGEKHHSAKLTEGDVRDIRARFASGDSQGRLAKTFGVNKASIAAIIHRKTWKHVIDKDLQS